jgi:hypothetical protein
VRTLERHFQHHTLERNKSKFSHNLRKLIEANQASSQSARLQFKVEKVSFATKNSMRFHEWSIDSYKTSCYQVLMKVAWCWRLREIIIMPTNNYYVATHHALLISVVALAVCTPHFYQFPVYMRVWITILHFSARKRSLYMDFGSGNCLINNPQASSYETLH